jgi:hypothetical protein
LLFLIAGDGWYMNQSVLAAVSFAISHDGESPHNIFFCYMVLRPYAGLLDGVYIVCFFASVSNHFCCF